MKSSPAATTPLTLRRDPRRGAATLSRRSCNPLDGWPHWLPESSAAEWSAIKGPIDAGFVDFKTFSSNGAEPVRFSGTLTFVPQRPEIESVTRIINADPEQIFTVLADPRMHRVIDGSGAVRDCKGKPQLLTLGSTFGMAMHAGVPYSMVSTVIEYVENRRIAWQTRGPTALGNYVGGRIWRYELEPVDGGTAVRETWDIGQESRLTKPMVRNAGAATRENMATTLQRLDDLLTKSGKIE